MLSVRDLSVSRTNNSTKQVILKDVNFDLNPREIIDIEGPSGSGKSTLLAAIAYMIHLESGEIFLDGKPQKDMNPVLWRGDVCLYMQKPVVLQASVRENLLLPWTFKLRSNDEPPSDAKLRKYLDKIDLGKIPLSRDATELSGGEQSRITLLRSVLTKPKVLLLDEPEANLDKKTAGIMLKFIQEFLSTNRAAIIRVQHHHWDKNIRRYIQIKNGKVNTEGLN